VIGHLCLIDFTLFRHLQLNGLEPEIGSGVFLCVGKMLGTPRHPFKKTVTSFLMFSLFAKPKFVGFLLCTNVPNLVEQYTKSGKRILTSFGFD
jgi:hypothetical protein